MRKRKGHTRLRGKGFTLIEIMVAIAVVAGAFISIYSLFSHTIRAEGVSRFYTVAPMLAQQKMAEITGGIVSPGFEVSGDFENHPEYNWLVSTADVVSDSLGPAVADMKQVDVTISLDNDVRSYTLRAYAFLPD